MYSLQGFVVERLLFFYFTNMY